MQQIFVPTENIIAVDEPHLPGGIAREDKACNIVTFSRKPPLKNQMEFLVGTGGGMKRPTMVALRHE
jgi:hypothetical protein